ncbi:hypothetical protein B0H13DRAFT_1884858 [Mycena leptocephala]|nr:hypothetical protein B0H13DRAFT_1884858 [Mycena leptocephala]
MDIAKEWPVAEGSETLTVKGDFRAYAQMKALKWAMNADVFILALDIDDLKDQPKNTEELKSIAAQRIAAMENEPDDATSAVIKDRNGVTLACVFARKSANVTKIRGEFIHSPILVLRDERSHNSLGYPGTKRSMTSSSASQFVQKYPDIPEASLWWYIQISHAPK